MPLGSGIPLHLKIIPWPLLGLPRRSPMWRHQDQLLAASGLTLAIPRNAPPQVAMITVGAPPQYIRHYCGRYRNAPPSPLLGSMSASSHGWTALLTGVPASAFARWAILCGYDYRDGIAPHTDW